MSGDFGLFGVLKVKTRLPCRTKLLLGSGMCQDGLEPGGPHHGARGGFRPPPAPFYMFILYLDESGYHAQADYFVLAGLAVFEREIHWSAQDIDALQRRYFPNITEPIEFHASPLRTSRDEDTPPPFNKLGRDERRDLISNIYQIIRNRQGILFGVAIEKAWRPNEDHYAFAFESLVSRFDLFVRRYNATADQGEHRGIIAVAESSYRENLEVLGERFRGGGTRWGSLHTLAEVPFFLPAKNTRLLQLADFCANAIYGRYNSGFTRDFDYIAPRFDREEGRIHGLAHLTRDYECQCPACLSRRD